jgi:hypothetical protein
MLQFAPDEFPDAGRFRQLKRCLGRQGGHGRLTGPAAFVEALCVKAQSFLGFVGARKKAGGYIASCEPGCAAARIGSA